MDEVDQYFADVASAAAICAQKDISNLDFVEGQVSKHPDELKKVMDIRKGLLAPGDDQGLAGYLATGLFSDFADDERLALVAYVFDIGRVLHRMNSRARFDRYKQEQPIFANGSDLFDCIRTKQNGKPDLELIDTSKISNVDATEIFERKGFFYKSESYLNSGVYPLVRRAFPSSSIFIRLDPTKQYNEKPTYSINESVLIPANPHWWKNLEISCRNKEGASYLQDCPSSPKESLQKFWEYRVHGARRLDVIAKRNGSGNLSMMLEELCTDLSDDGLLYGRCIHLDTDDPVGTPFSNSCVNHLDLALNVYENGDVQARMDTNLASGSVVADASYRTHLLRIEHIPLKSLLLFIELFFRSKTMITEWLEDQFYR